MILYPSILTDQDSTAKNQLGLAADLHHQLKEKIIVRLDIIDGQFVDNLTLSPADYAQFEFDGLEADFHLMVEEPVDLVYEVLEHKQSLPARGLIAQVERLSSQSHYLDEVLKNELKAGLSLDLHTPLDAIDENSWEKLDFLQLMSIEAGEQGRVFDERIWEKIAAAASLRQARQLEFELSVDGGVKLDLISRLAAAGANAVEVGSGFWQADNLLSTYQQFIVS